MMMTFKNEEANVKLDIQFKITKSMKQIKLI